MLFRRILMRILPPLFRPVAYRLDGGPMRAFGIRNTMRMARLYNGIYRGPLQKRRERLYRSDLSRLSLENGKLPQIVPVLRDGFYLDCDWA